MAHYADIFTNFTAHPDTRRLLMKTDDRAIAQSLRNRVLINRGERPFERHIGGNVRKCLFEEFSDSQTNTLEELIRETLTSEKRVKIEDVIVEPRPRYNTYHITILYRTANSPNQQSTQITLSRVR